MFAALSPAAQAYLALIAGIAAASFGVPIPEEVPLLTAGFVAALGVIDLPTTIGIACAACVGGDVLVYAVGRRVGSHLEDHPRLRRILRGRHMRRARHLYVHRGPWTLFFARLMPGLKMPFLFTAGALHMPWKRFLLYDLASVAVLAPGLILLAYHSSLSLSQLTDRVREWCAWAVPAFLATLAVVALVFVRSRRRRRAPRVADPRP